MARRAPTSPLADALARVGDRWTLLVVAALLDGPRRFNELQDELEGIAPNVLSARLKALAEQALVVAQPYSERPPRGRGAVPARAVRHRARGPLVVPDVRAGRGRPRRRGRARPRLTQARRRRARCRTDEVAAADRSH